MKSQQTTRAALRCLLTTNDVVSGPVWRRRSAGRYTAGTAKARLTRDSRLNLHAVAIAVADAVADRDYHGGVRRLQGQNGFKKMMPRLSSDHNKKVFGIANTRAPAPARALSVGVEARPEGAQQQLQRTNGLTVQPRVVAWRFALQLINPSYLSIDRSRSFALICSAF